MKVRVLLIFFICLTPLLSANPIVMTPVIKFSELAFDEHNNWTMELYFQYPKLYKNIDSILIKVSGLSSKLNIQLRGDSTYYYVITSDSLITPLPLLPDNSEISIYTYSNANSGGKVFLDIINSGNLSKYPECSLCRATVRHLNNYTNFCYLSKVHTMGKPNILEGQRVSGHIYNAENRLVTKYFRESNGNEYYFEIQEPITINPDGTYSTLMYPTCYFPDSTTVTGLSVRIPDFPAYSQTQEIEPLYLTYIKADTTLKRDIHLKSSKYVVTGVERKEIQTNNELTLINYPNPFNSSTNFFVKLPDNIKDKTGEINIYNAAGRMIRTISVNIGAVSWWDGKDMNGRTMASGIYYYQLNVNSKMLKSGSMILLK